MLFFVIKENKSKKKGKCGEKKIPACTGRWESRIGIPGSRHLYLGLFESETEAAKMYDRALVRLRGASAATNFAVSDYKADLAAHYQMKQVCLAQAQKSSASRLIKQPWADLPAHYQMKQVCLV